MTAAVTTPDRVEVGGTVWSRVPDATWCATGWRLALELGRPVPAAKAERVADEHPAERVAAEARRLAEEVVDDHLDGEEYGLVSPWLAQRVRRTVEHTRFAAVGARRVAAVVSLPPGCLEDSVVRRVLRDAAVAAGGVADSQDVRVVTSPTGCSFMASW